MSFGRTKCDRSVVSDLQTARIPCCCRQQRRGSDTPLIYGKTAVDLNSVSGYLLGAGFLVLESFCTKAEGKPLETRKHDRRFFSSEMAVGLVTRHFARSYRHLTIPRFTD